MVLEPLDRIRVTVKGKTRTVTFLRWVNDNTMLTALVVPDGGDITRHCRVKVQHIEDPNQ